MRILKSFEAAGHGTEDDDEVHVEDLINYNQGVKAEEAPGARFSQRSWR